MSSNFTSGTPDTSSTMKTTQDFYDDSVRSGASSASSGDALRAELSNLKTDLDALMSKASGLTDRELSDARDKLVGKFRSMRHAAQGVATEANRQLHHGMDVTTDYVKEKPLQSVAIATGVGLLLGAVLRRH